MVTATENPNVWRVEITAVHSPKSKSEIVCYLAIADEGLRVYYSHHMLYERPVSAGPWGKGTPVWHTVSPQLEALIESSMSEALWEIARGKNACKILQFPATELNRLNPDLTELAL